MFNEPNLKEDDKFLNSLLKGTRKIYILWLISRKKMHGYGLISKLNEAVPEGGKKLVHGSTIYPLLHDLEKRGLITSSKELNGKHKIKLYEITDEGVNALNHIKKFIKNRPNDDVIVSFLDDMVFNEKIFTKIDEGE